MRRRLPSAPGSRSPESLQLIRRGGQRFRIGPWRGEPTVGYLAPLGPSTPTPPGPLAEAVDDLHRLGYAEIVTSALSRRDLPSFTGLGFEVYEELHLLACPLGRRRWWRRRGSRPAQHGLVRLRAGTDADRETVLHLDQRAFDGFWRLDDAGLDEALGATPTASYRIATDPDGTIVGYAVTGATADTGYLQRLAVDPDLHGRGIGRLLVDDAIAWCRHRGDHTIMVNTQLRNEVALRLYQSCGFQLQDERLVVMRRPARPPSPTDLPTATTASRSAHPAGQRLDG